jgi:hypothetical protein
METEYVSFEPPSVAAVRMARGPFFIKAFAASWRFFDLDDGKTRVSFKYFLDLRRPCGFLMPFIDGLQRYFAADGVSQRYTLPSR